MTETIFALSNGSVPAAIGLIRISGPDARTALASLTDRFPQPRHASLRRLRDPSGGVLDEALVLWLPGPGTATGEDVVELHCHGGRAVIAAVERALGSLPGLRRAAPGEFTRRAFSNGRIDLAEAEGLADLLAAETELQRRNAQSLATGELSRTAERWRAELLELSAMIEASLDFSDEADVITLPGECLCRVERLAAQLAEWLARPRAEALHEGFRVVLAGPPNAGKSTLFNALVGSDAAITTPIAGTTRDLLTRPVALAGIPFMFVDTAGLHDHSGDPIERIGIARARDAIAGADLVLWLGPEGQGPAGSCEIEAQCDRFDFPVKQGCRHRVSAVTGEGIPELLAALAQRALMMMPKPGELALNARQHALLSDACTMLDEIRAMGDPLLVAEHLRLARVAFDALLGRSATEDMLDTLFTRFCIGK